MSTIKKGGRRRPPGKKKVKKFPNMFAGEPLTQKELEQVVRIITFQRKHKKLERQRKRAKRKRTWAVKPGR